MEIRWSLPAADDLERLCTWIERDNPEAARRVAKIIYDRCSQLKDFPHDGAREPPDERTARAYIPSLALHRRVSGEGRRG